MLPLIVAIAVAAFSPQAANHLVLKPTLAPDAFNDTKVISDMQELSARYPRRQAGSPGDQSLAKEIQRRFKQTKGFEVSTETKALATINGKQKLTTIQARRVGTVDRRIVVVATRDSESTQATTQLSGTAILLELARLFSAPSRTKASLLFVSTSGQTTGQAGLTSLAQKLNPNDTVIVIGDVATNQGKPEIVPWSNRLGVTPSLLEETVRFAVNREANVSPKRASFTEQWLRFALPVTSSSAGQLLAHKIPTTMLQVGGEQTRTTQAAFDKERFANLGRSILSAINAIDTSKKALGTTSIETIRWKTKQFPTWSIMLLALSGFFAPLVAGVDALAKANRNGTLSTQSLQRFFSLIAAVCCGFLVALGVVHFDLITLPSALPAARFLRLSWLTVGPTIIGLLCTTAILIISQLKGRLLPQSEGLTATIILSLLLTVIAFFNPFLAVLWIPTVHFWLFASDTVLIPNRAIRAILALAGVVPLLLCLMQIPHYLDVNTLQALNGIIIAFTGGQIGFFQTVFWILAFSCSFALFLSTFAHGNNKNMTEAGLKTRAVASYAGPGSLGGTTSALSGRERSQY